jgi:hypothetical protein
MKLKFLVSLAVMAALVAGFFLGRWQTRHTVDSYFLQMSRPEVKRATADFSKAAGLLKAIHAGDTNAAIERLESELDTQILYIGAVTEATPVSERDKQWLSRIRWLRNYRADHPRKTETPAIDEQVAHFLSLVETNR